MLARLGRRPLLGRVADWHLDERCIHRRHNHLAHCFTCSKDGHASARISAALTTRGVAVLRFDFTGLGQSGGDFANSNFSSNIADLLAAAGWMGSQGHAPSVLVGHFLGGAAVLAAAGDIDEVVAVATVGAPCSPEHVSHLIVEADPELATTGQTRVSIGGRIFSIKAASWKTSPRNPRPQRIAALGRPLLVLHSPQDQIVGVDNARAIFDAARHPKSFVALYGADHLLTQPADAEFVAPSSQPGFVGTYPKSPRYRTSPPPGKKLPQLRLPPSPASSSLRRNGVATFTRSALVGAPGPWTNPIAQAGRRRRPDTVRHAAVRAGGVHVDDDAHVCRKQGMRHGPHHREVAAQSHPRPGL